MKAIIWKKYGAADVLQPGEVKRPSPKEGEVLIKIHATTVTAGDCEMRSFSFPAWLWVILRLYIGFSRPKRITILGQELAGEVVSAGREVKLFKNGDKVFAHTGFRMGAYAEYVTLPEKGLIAQKPENMTYDEAAAVPTGGLEALYYLRKANIQNGQEVLINGAGGSIGTFAIQIAKNFGALVTAVDSTEKLDMLLSIGADHVIDYKKEDFTRSGKAYDVVFDVVGKSPITGILKSLKQNGSYLLANPRPSIMIGGPWVSMVSGKKIVAGATEQKPEDLVFLKRIIEEGKIRTIIDKKYPLKDIIKAHRYVEQGHKKGNVVIVVN